MGLGKSFGISIITFLILNFILNFLLLFSSGYSVEFYFSNIKNVPWQFLASLFISTTLLSTPLTGVFNVLLMHLGFFNSTLFENIMFILAAIIPSLIASIVAGKMADSRIQAFQGWMLTMLLSACFIIAFYNINSTQVALNILNVMSLGSNMVLEAMWIMIFCVINGLFWSGIAVIISKKS